ncbi:MAG: signal peptidase II, partial [Gemmatimonadota bacterium]|nr:signal peptidase II [Gemmatimonadota bacterium]
NLVDRFRSPMGVVDFIDIGYGHVRFWTFNVADSAVTVGAILLAWSLSQEDRQQRQAETRAEAEASVPDMVVGAPDGVLSRVELHRDEPRA